MKNLLLLGATLLLLGFQSLEAGLKENASNAFQPQFPTNSEQTHSEFPTSIAQTNSEFSTSIEQDKQQQTTQNRQVVQEPVQNSMAPSRINIKVIKKLTQLPTGKQYLEAATYTRHPEPTKNQVIAIAKKLGAHFVYVHPYNKDYIFVYYYK